MAGEPPAIDPWIAVAIPPPSQTAQWWQFPQEPPEHPLQPPPVDPTKPRSPLKAKVENCRVTRLLSHWGQRTRVRLEGTRFSKAFAHSSQVYS